MICGTGGQSECPFRLLPETPQYGPIKKLLAIAALLVGLFHLEVMLCGQTLSGSFLRNFRLHHGGDRGRLCSATVHLSAYQADQSALLAGDNARVRALAYPGTKGKFCF